MQAVIYNRENIVSTRSSSTGEATRRSTLTRQLSDNYLRFHVKTCSALNAGDLFTQTSINLTKHVTGAYGGYHEFLRNSIWLACTEFL
jgi:hypothetical protein